MGTQKAMSNSAVLEATIERFRTDPGSAQTSPAVTAVLEDERIRLSGGPFVWETDLPPILGGENAAPSPTAYLLGALAGCAVVFIYDTLAPQLGVPVDAVSAVASCGSDLRGLLKMDGADPRLTGFAIDITIDSPAAPEKVAELQKAWLDRCPIYLSLLEPAEVEVNWQHHGRTD